MPLSAGDIATIVGVAVAAPPFFFYIWQGASFIRRRLSRKLSEDEEQAIALLNNSSPGHTVSFGPPMGIYIVCPSYLSSGITDHVITLRSRMLGVNS
ncbi:hypothetical protein L207DRAFT_639929 [Hyaloscypha variabilis F]|uniref:Uncharacterized protein n=1 Tax=Hyaloscypha variabilis (strain UAMH 11265 / GT02V1 / F) TaxID=1149755 RepID=A0A2J6R2C0_HYAVF|nr:hypothetical protein L207DRAFT_639929 [Hyaloscypha variabilis F]